MENNTQVQSQGESSGLAIASLVLSLLLIIPLTGLVGLILGIIALVKISNSNGKLTGKKMALTGVIVGGIRVVVFPIILTIIGAILSFTLPGLINGSETALNVKADSELRQTGIAIYAYAKDNNGTLPNELYELIEQDYVDEINEEFVYNLQEGYIYYAPGENLYSMNADDILVEDPKYEAILYTDGSVEYQEDE